MTREIITTQKAPSAIGPYSQAIKTKEMVFVSGQLAIDPISGALISGDIRKETRQALTNLKQILLAAGSGLDRVIKTTLFISNMDDFTSINDVYAEFFNQDPPARACVQVARLPKDANVEVEAMALL
jgi:2-iminobutanoate/2-iminopropanoate deaminase